MKRTFGGLRTGAAVILVLLFSTLPARAENSGPEALVSAFHDGLIKVMRDAKNLGIRGRYEKSLTLLDKHFHMPLMVHFVTGEHWKSATKEQQRALLMAARSFSAGELAVLFSGFGGERFKTVRTRTIQDKSILVETSLVRPEADNVSVIYRTMKFGKNWRIIDVLLDGSISQLLKRKGEYRRTLKLGGVPALTELLQKKSAEILSDPN